MVSKSQIYGCSGGYCPSLALACSRLPHHPFCLAPFPAWDAHATQSCIHLKEVSTSIGKATQQAVEYKHPQGCGVTGVGLASHSVVDTHGVYFLSLNRPMSTVMAGGGGRGVFKQAMSQGLPPLDH